MSMFSEEQGSNFISDKFTIDELLHRSWRLRDSKEFTRFFDFIARFQHYSRFNTMLVYIQNEAVTFFGGVSYWWKKFQRKVNQDARPYIILAPSGPIMLVYDIFDTVGKETPEEFLKNGLGSEPFDVRGILEVDMMEYALEEAKSLGISIKYRPLSYFNGGYVTTIYKGYLEICLKEGQNIEQDFAVLIHELAHLFLGHTGHNELHHLRKKNPIKLPQRKLSRTAEELEAETVSFLICKKLGLESRSAEYIAGYISNEQDLLSFSYETVIKTADKIEKLFVKKREANKEILFSLF